MHDTLRALACINAPVILMQMVTLLFMANGFMEQDLHMVEYFAGQMEVSCHHFRLHLVSMYVFMFRLHLVSVDSQCLFTKHVVVFTSKYPCPG